MIALAILLFINAVFNVLVWPRFYTRVAKDPRARGADGKPTRFLVVHAVLIALALVIALASAIAAIAAMFRMSFTVELVEQIWIGCGTPVRIGPITVAPAISCISLTLMDAEWRAGTTSTLAGPVRRLNG